MSVKKDYKININDNKNSLNINNNFKEGEGLFNNQNKETNNVGKYKNDLKEKLINNGDNIKDKSKITNITNENNNKNIINENINKITFKNNKNKFTIKENNNKVKNKINIKDNENKNKNKNLNNENKDVNKNLNNEDKNNNIINSVNNTRILNEKIEEYKILENNNKDKKEEINNIFININDPYNSNNNINNNNNKVDDNNNNNVVDSGNCLNNFLENYINQKFVKIDNILYYKQNNILRKVINNQEEKWKLINAAHTIGHEGIYKTYHRLRRDFYWKGMIKLFIKCCNNCQTCKPQPMNIYPEDLVTPPGLPFSRIGLDLIVPLYRTKR